MTLVYTSDDEGPGTHALIVALGEVPGEEGRLLAPTAAAAGKIASWLIGRYNNPGAPLASIDLLAALPPGPMAYVRPDGGEFTLDRPTFGAVMTAAERWFERASTHEGNIALFYFVGLGRASAGDPVMLFDETQPSADGRPVRAALDIGALRDAMQACRARRQLYVVEALEYAPRSDDSETATGFYFGERLPEPAKLIFVKSFYPDHGPDLAAMARAIPDGSTPFSQILCDTLDEIVAGPQGQVAATALLAERLPARLEERYPDGPFLAIPQADHFDFHYPPGDAAADETLTEAAGEFVPGEAEAKHEQTDSRILEEAVASYRATLITLSRDRQPREWVATLEKIGDALRILGERHGNPALLEEAVAVSRQALEVHTRDDFPLEWARTQINLGHALRAQGLRLTKTELIEEAALAYRSALEAYSRDRQPLEWAAAQIELGKTLQLAGELRDEPGTVEQAVRAFDAALLVYTMERDPVHRPMADSSRREAIATLAYLTERTWAPKKPPTRKRKPAPPETPPPPPPPPAAPTDDEEANTDFVLDDAEAEHDSLGRAVLAIGLARRLHKIWRNTNRAAAPADDARAAFVVHLDAPWGGGKTTFANFLARVLDPLPDGPGSGASFLAERYPGADLGGIFLDDPPADAAAVAALAAVPAAERRPWAVVNFNAWQAEHCAPPWWVFYQAIRKGCATAVLGEGSGAWRPRLPLDDKAGPRARFGHALSLGAARAGARLGGLARWAWLWAVEYGWRLFNPKIRALLGTAAASLVLLWILVHYHVWGLIQTERGLGIGYILTNPVGLALTGLSSVTGLWALAALFTESIVPGTDTLAERLSLGGGDPFARFRRHFAHTMARVGRPVMVVVDDLDRCRPDFVVDLVRGIQTLLRSPRVTFLILGDRDWIERAFEAHHAAMKTVDVGPEQTFGARFVEKAIQLSFILPALGGSGRVGYVRRVLLGGRAAPAGATATKADAAAAGTDAATPARGAGEAAGRGQRRRHRGRRRHCERRRDRGRHCRERRLRSKSGRRRDRGRRRRSEGGRRRGRQRGRKAARGRGGESGGGRSRRQGARGAAARRRLPAASVVRQRAAGRAGVGAACRRAARRRGRAGRRRGRPAGRRGDAGGAPALGGAPPGVRRRERQVGPRGGAGGCPAGLRPGRAPPGVRRPGRQAGRNGGTRRAQADP
jgi:tetratricopeptide (TPR) repeat protein